MGVLVGPTPWWQSNIVRSCPVGTTLPDGSKIVCKAAQTAWIVAPSSTQVSMAWAGGQYNSALVGDKCCISEWSTLQTCLITSGFNPADWFVPSNSQLQSGYNCRTQWDTFSSATYWSSTEFSCTIAYTVRFQCGGDIFGTSKTNTFCVRAFRCVTY